MPEIDNSWEYFCVLGRFLGDIAFVNCRAIVNSDELLLFFLINALDFILAKVQHHRYRAVN
jgi:hypothetical protein